MHQPTLAIIWELFAAAAVVLLGIVLPMPDISLFGWAPDPFARYLIAVNAVTFALFMGDCAYSMRNNTQLFHPAVSNLFAVAGGAGGMAAMRVFNHKARTPAFSHGLPLLLAAQLFVVGALVLSGVT